MKKINTLLSFKIGKETYAVPVQKALEVLERQHITRMPNAPPYIEGVINFRGKIIPVIDTRIKFNLEKRSEADKFVIIVLDLNLNDKKMLIGALADNVEDVVSLDESGILEVPELGLSHDSNFISGMFKNESSFTIILDVDKVFTIEEVKVFDQIQEETKDLNIQESIEVGSFIIDNESNKSEI